MTSKLYYDVRIRSNLSLQILIKFFSESIQSISVEVNNRNNSKYLQDAFIMFKKLEHHSENYGIQVSPATQDFINKVKPLTIIEDIDNNGLNLGGNFISSPTTLVSKNGCLFNISGISDSLNEKLNKILIQDRVELKCSFRCQGERHIDEIMTFMPYGNFFKVWIYKPTKLVLSDKLIERFLNEQELINTIVREGKEYFLKPLRNYIQDKIDLIKNKLILKKRVGKIINHLKQLYSILENERYEEAKEYYTINNLYKVNLPNELVFYITILKKKTAIQQLFPDYQMKRIGIRRQEFIKKINAEALKRLEVEWKYNVNIISNKLFGRNNQEIRKYFVFFPFELEVNQNLNFKILHPPVFNRLWIELPEACYFFRSTDINNEETDIIVNQELPYLKSMINPSKKIFYNKINTTEFNNDGTCGGNLHCLVKQKF